MNMKEKDVCDRLSRVFGGKNLPPLVEEQKKKYFSRANSKSSEGSSSSSYDEKISHAQLYKIVDAIRQIFRKKMPVSENKKLNGINSEGQPYFYVTGYTPQGIKDFILSNAQIKPEVWDSCKIDDVFRVTFLRNCDILTFANRTFDEIPYVIYFNGADRNNINDIKKKKSNVILWLWVAPEIINEIIEESKINSLANDFNEKINYTDKKIEEVKKTFEEKIEEVKNTFEEKIICVEDKIDRLDKKIEELNENIKNALLR